MDKRPKYVRYQWVTTNIWNPMGPGETIQHHVYYVRVLEIPKPRWSAYDQKRFGIKMPDNVPMKVQDRAYTSPIWYTP